MVTSVEELQLLEKIEESWSNFLEIENINVNLYSPKENEKLNFDSLEISFVISCKSFSSSDLILSYITKLFMSLFKQEKIIYKFKLIFRQLLSFAIKEFISDIKSRLEKVITHLEKMNIIKNSK